MNLHLKSNFLDKKSNIVNNINRFAFCLNLDFGFLNFQNKIVIEELTI